MLTKEEQEEFDKLRYGFNIIKESDDYNIRASLRVDVARPVADRLLKLSFYLNIGSIICFAISLVLTFTKPLPNYYGSMPNGKIYPLTTTKLPKG